MRAKSANAMVITARRSGRTVATGRHTKYLPRTPVAPQLRAMLAQQAQEPLDATGGGYNI